MEEGCHPGAGIDRRGLCPPGLQRMEGPRQRGKVREQREERCVFWVVRGPQRHRQGSFFQGGWEGQIWGLKGQVGKCELDPEVRGSKALA